MKKLFVIFSAVVLSSACLQAADPQYDLSYDYAGVSPLSGDRVTTTIYDVSPGVVGVDVTVDMPMRYTYDSVGALEFSVPSNDVSSPLTITPEHGAPTAYIYDPNPPAPSNPAGDFPARSFFDVFVELSLPGSPLPTTYTYDIGGPNGMVAGDFHGAAAEIQDMQSGSPRLGFLTTPEPSTYLLLASLLGLLGLSRRFGLNLVQTAASE